MIEALDNGAHSNGNYPTSSRRTAELGTTSPYPIIDRLPGLFQGDDFTRRFTRGLDDVWGDLFVTMDNLHAYLEPATAPGDFVAWLATWVGFAIDENWPESRQRALVERAVDLYRWRGTVRGLREVVEVYTGVVPEIVDSGGVEWSLSPGEPPPGEPGQSVTIRLHADAAGQIDAGRLGALVADSVPAHVRWALEVDEPS